MTRLSFRTGVLLPVMLLGCLGSASTADAAIKFYAEGRGWSVAFENDSSTCTLILPFGRQQVLLRTFRPQGVTKYSIMFWDENRIPTKTSYNYELSNERGPILSEAGRAFANGDHGTVVIGLFDADVVDAISHGKMLYVKADGVDAGQYDLSGVGNGFRRFSDCLRDAGSRKTAPPSAPLARRMN